MFKIKKWSTVTMASIFGCAAVVIASPNLAVDCVALIVEAALVIAHIKLVNRGL